jgi:hypothetical protein
MRIQISCKDCISWLIKLHQHASKYLYLNKAKLPDLINSLAGNADSFFYPDPAEGRMPPTMASWLHPLAAPMRHP